MKANILLIEDDLRILELLESTLIDEGYGVTTATNGMDGFELYNKDKFDLIMTDLLMPNLDGKGLIKLVRNKDQKIPIIILTALDDEVDQIEGLDIGADDYITKPFSIGVVLKRLEKILSRVSDKPREVVVGDIMIIEDALEIYYKEEKIDLTVKEFQILLYLIENKNRVVSREQIIEHVWGYQFHGETSNITTHIKNIRNKIDFDNIKAIKGIGYKYVE
jgi:two-component system response regulator VanR